MPYIDFFINGPFTRYVKLRVEHALGMPETFLRHRLQRKPQVNDTGMHHGTCVTHVPWCMSGSLTRGGRDNAPGISSACEIRNFTYLVRGSYRHLSIDYISILIHLNLTIVLIYAPLEKCALLFKTHAAIDQDESEMFPFHHDAALCTLLLTWLCEMSRLTPLTTRRRTTY